MGSTRHLFFKTSDPCHQNALSLIPSISLSMSYIGSSPKISTQQSTANALEVSMASAAPLDAMMYMREYSTFPCHILLFEEFKNLCMSLSPGQFGETSPPSISQKNFVV